MVLSTSFAYLMLPLSFPHLPGMLHSHLSLLLCFVFFFCHSSGSMFDDEILEMYKQNDIHATQIL